MPTAHPSEVHTLQRTVLPTLRKRDPRLGWLIEQVGPFAMPKPQQRGHLEALVRSIVYQQLSGKAAATIFGRFRALFDQSQFPTAQQIVAYDEQALRSCGLSTAKTLYVRSLCQAVVDDPRFLSDCDALDDEAIVKKLTSVRGIGRWSAEMFLMFHLGRLDVWPVGDLGVRKAMQRLHRLPELPSANELTALGQRYAPYRSVASWYLWRLLELPTQVPDEL